MLHTSKILCIFAVVLNQYRICMILDKLENADLYFDCIPELEQVIRFVNDNELEDLPACRIRLDGDNLYVNINVLQPRPEKDFLLEAHQDYIDVQIPLSGTERMGWRPQEDCQTIAKEYDEGKDIEFYKDQPVNLFDVPVGYFAVFFPSDAHQPGIISQANHKKVVAKIKVKE
mgnify:CR=1 FL=1